MSAAAPPATAVASTCSPGPNWKGDKPEGINDVIRSDTDLAMVLYRTQLFGPDDIDNVSKIQAGYQVAAAVGVPQPAAARRRPRRSTSSRR